MDYFSDSRCIKQLAKTVIAENDLKKEALSRRLRPPVNLKTFSRLLNTDQPPSPAQRQAMIGLLAHELAIPTQMVEHFERMPLADEHFHLLCRVAGESYAITEHALAQLATRITLLEAKSNRIRLFDTGLPDELWPPSPDQVERVQNRMCSVTILRSTLKPFAPANRPFGFGDQDDRDETIENIIGAVETGRVNLGIVDDLATANAQNVLAAVAPYQHITLYDDRAALLRLRNASAFCLITAEGNPAAATVIRTLAAAMDRLDNHLCHAPNSASVVSLLETFLSPSSWRTRLMRWKRCR